MEEAKRIASGREGERKREGNDVTHYRKGTKSIFSHGLLANGIKDSVLLSVPFSSYRDLLLGTLTIYNSRGDTIDIHEMQ